MGAESGQWKSATRQTDNLCHSLTRFIIVNINIQKVYVIVLQGLFLILTFNNYHKQT